MQNMNPIPVDFLETFSKTDIGMSLANEGYTLIQQYENNLPRTPREIAMMKAFPVDSFYYIDFLLKDNPKKIYDIGCGSNIWKKFYPNVIGIDPVGDFADIKDFFDDDFIKYHTEEFEAVITIDALHFIPINEFATRLQQIYSILRKNSKAFIAFNVQRMIESTPITELCKISNHATENVKTQVSITDKNFINDIEKYLREELTYLDFNFLCVDVNFERYSQDAYLDGNIRLVIEKVGK